VKATGNQWDRGLLRRSHGSSASSSLSPEGKAVVLNWLLEHLDGSLFSIAVVALALMKVRIRVRRSSRGWQSIDVQLGSRRYDDER
jgi:hypothetical protein